MDIDMYKLIIIITSILSFAFLWKQAQTYDFFLQGVKQCKGDSACIELVADFSKKVERR